MPLRLVLAMRCNPLGQLFIFACKGSGIDSDSKVFELVLEVPWEARTHCWACRWHRRIENKGFGKRTIGLWVIRPGRVLGQVREHPGGLKRVGNGVFFSGVMSGAYDGVEIHASSEDSLAGSCLPTHEAVSEIHTILIPCCGWCVTGGGLCVCCVRRLGPHLLRHLNTVLTATFQR